MRSVFYMLLFVLAGTAGNTQPILGDWHGVLDLPGSKLRIVFHLTKSGNGYAATLDSPDQSAFGLPAGETTVDNNTLEIKMPNLGAHFKGAFDEAAQTINGTFTQGGAALPLNMGRKAQEKQETVRPQNPKAPLPYTQEDVQYANPAADGVTLAGTLTLPQGTGPFPAVVMISGSGPQNRDEELLGHKPFLVVADHFTRQGIAVLRFDDRGVGKSTGDFKTATSADFASDVLAGIRFLKTRKEINTRKIGLVGHSEGGLIAPMVAAQSQDVAFIVLMAGPGVSGADIVILQSELISRAEGESEKTIASNDKFLKKAFKALRNTKDLEATKIKLKKSLTREINKLPAADQEKLGPVDQVVNSQVDAISSPWFQFFLTYEPSTSLEKVTCPVLAINGGKDLQVDPKQNLPAIEAALKKGGNTRYLIKELPGLNHLFQHTETGKPSEYGKIEETFSTDAMALMAKWILEQAQ